MTAETGDAPRVAIVTGSSSGIGEATARALATDGYAVVVNSSSSVEAGRAVAASLPAAFYVQADVADEDQSRALVDATVERFGRLDVLVNNAGTTKVIPHADLDAVTDELFLRILSVNVLGPWHMIKASLPHLRATGDGVIVNVSSIAGIRSRGSSIPYAVSKAGLNHLTMLVANVLGPEVRVNAVAPGLIMTPWTADWDRNHEAITRAAPLARAGTAGDVAETIMGVVRSRYMSGQVVVVDGGVTAR